MQYYSAHLPDHQFFTHRHTYDGPRTIDDFNYADDLLSFEGVGRERDVEKRSRKLCSNL